ncbi:hypothetical protein PFICI_06894 [Pestalotiopsis fici W106-1]|uniref:Rhodopsin domain-containing protein n=1 Tax=Pestalotiopsis fici (strain W106-1 / CGMCC3.15140) TaxID=1229662 RepID=W3X921_PESFW|nr:uncharacterized protein PFICI_06894 [Pestalotiopsis fici W106-1]ETS81892.1 hypothetical protein PFICI_06894 [Pestalotiopsis fici W106-1]
MVVLNDESRLTLRTDIALEVIVTLAVLCRFACRWGQRAAFSWDDGWMVFAWAAYTAYTGLSMASGLLDGRGNDTKIGELEYVAMVMFETAHVGAKASLVCLCWRSLAARELKFWRSAILGLCVAWYISSVLVTLFHCSPILVTWSPIESPPKCIDIVMFALGYEMGSIVCNLAIILPNICVWILGPYDLRSEDKMFIQSQRSSRLFASVQDMVHGVGGIQHRLRKPASIRATSRDQERAEPVFWQAQQ